jgi:hypothetical protein
MGNLKKQFATNVEKEMSGVWVDLAEGVRLRIARWNNPQQVVRTLELQRPYWKQHNRRSPDIKKQAEILTQVIAETVLVGWDNVTDDAGNAVPYSREKALEYLSDPAMHDFREFVVNEAQDQAKYRDEDLEDAAKNS